MKKHVLSLVVAALALAGSSAACAQGVSFLAILSGGDEVPANTSPARGIALFRLDDDGSTVHYTLIVAHIQNAVAAHIHTAPVGVSGPVVVPLFGAPVEEAGLERFDEWNGGRRDGPLAVESPAHECPRDGRDP